MRDSIKNAIGETVQDLINSGFKTSFTEKELNSLGVSIPEVHLDSSNKSNQRNLECESNGFCQIVKCESIFNRQWEQGKRTSTGSTRVLLDLLKRFPHILDYRLKA